MDPNDYRPAGLFAAAVTPFRDDEKVDEDRLASLFRSMLEAGADGLMVTGGCGEYANLTPDERRRVVTLARACTQRDGAPVIVGALGSSTREVVELGVHAAAEGATALLVLPPYYIRPSLDGVLDHYETVVRETGLPVIAYNNPGRTGWPIGLAELQKIAAIPGVVGVKECERDIASISLKIAKLQGRFQIISGDDDLGFHTLLSGARCAIWASPNLHPLLSRQLFDAGLARDITGGIPLHLRVTRLMTTWMIANHPAPLKLAMTMLGRSAGPARRPLGGMTPDQVAALKEALEQNGPIA